MEQSVKNKKSLVFENLNIDWNLPTEENSTDFSDEDFNEEKLSAKEYFDWLLNSRNNQSVKRSNADTNSIISTDAQIYKNNLENQSRSSSVLDQFHSIQHNNNILNKLNNNQPPPLPPHKNIVKQALSQSNNNSQNVKNNNLSKKEQFLKGNSKTTMHTRTISDLGLKAAINGHRKNASVDLSSSFSTNNNQSNQKNLNARRRTYIDSCTQLNLDSHPHSLLNSVKRPAIPPPLVPIGHQTKHSNSQTNLLSSNPFMHNNNNNNNIVNKNENGKLIRRKQPIYIENRHLSNGQSFESLPSSDDLNNSNNSNPHHLINCCSNINSYNAVPIPPPRKRDVPPKLRTCIALFDCNKDQDDELQFKKNEIIEILKETDEADWLLGRIGKREGVFPISFVQMLN